MNRIRNRAVRPVRPVGTVVAVALAVLVIAGLAVLGSVALRQVRVSGSAIPVGSGTSADSTGQVTSSGAAVTTSTESVSGPSGPVTTSSDPVTTSVGDRIEDPLEAFLRPVSIVPGSYHLASVDAAPTEVALVAEIGEHGTTMVVTGPCGVAAGPIAELDGRFYWGRSLAWVGKVRLAHRERDCTEDERSLSEDLEQATGDGVPLDIGHGWFELGYGDGVLRFEY